MRSCGQWKTEYTMRGVPFLTWEPPVPRISDEYLSCVAYLYRSKEEAIESINIGGSAFLISMPVEGFPPPAHLVYVVTNKHVIDNKARFLRVNRNGGGVDVLELKNWHRSKDDDLAVCLLPKLNPFLYSIGSISVSRFLTREIADEWNIGPGDEVILIGRFVNVEGKQRNIPSVRFGHIAQMPIEPLEYEGQFQESFLCEIKSIGGFSGSPVFVAPMILPRDTDGKEPEETSYLLGIDWCHIQNFENAVDADGYEIKNIRVPINTGMMGVVPAWNLQKLLDVDEVANMRKKTIEDEKARRNLPKISLDASSEHNVGPLATDENPKHREDFNSLLGVAARKPKSGD